MGRWHAHAAAKLGATVCAIIDADLSAAKRLAQRVGPNCESFANILDAHRTIDFQVLHICTPLATHADLAKQALALNKHLIVEKPLVASSATLRELQGIAQQQARLLCPVHQFAFQRGVNQIKDELSRRVAKPLTVVFDFASAGGLDLHGEALNQLLLEILPHPISILLDIWPNGSLDGESWWVDNPIDGELFAHGHYNAMAVSIKLSLHARPTHSTMTIYHLDGALRANLFHGFAVFDSATTSRFTKISAPFVDSFKTFYAASINLLRRTLSREPAYPGLRNLLAGCYQSIAQETPPPISDAQALGVALFCESVALKLSEQQQQEQSVSSVQ